MKILHFALLVAANFYVFWEIRHANRLAQGLDARLKEMKRD